MSRAEAFRLLVTARAGGACEYCRLLEAAAGVTFHIEHVLPRSHGGHTQMGNLALSCPGCNLAKAQRTHGVDQGGHPQPLFNPRDYEPWLLGWHLHFILDRDTGVIAARTAVGHATVTALDSDGAGHERCTPRVRASIATPRRADRLMAGPSLRHVIVARSLVIPAARLGRLTRAPLRPTQQARRHPRARDE